MKYKFQYSNKERLHTNSETMIVESWCKISAYFKFYSQVQGNVLIHHVHRIKPVMKHINKDFKGWFSYAGFYTDMVNKFPDGATMVEVGVYEGKSLAFLVVEGINTGKNFKVYGVDIFPDGIKKNFDRNMEPINELFTTLHKSSVEAAAIFRNNSIDFVFIDAAHDYASVTADILAWLPKVKKGGIIAGHDYTPEWIEVMNAVDDFFPDISRKYIGQQVWMKQL